MRDFMFFDGHWLTNQRAQTFQPLNLRGCHFKNVFIYENSRKFFLIIYLINPVTIFLNLTIKLLTWCFGRLRALAESDIIDGDNSVSRGSPLRFELNSHFFNLLKLFLLTHFVKHFLKNIFVNHNYYEKTFFGFLAETFRSL